MKIRYGLLLLAATLLAWASPALAMRGMTDGQGAGRPEFVAGQALLKVAPGVSSRQTAAAVKASVLQEIGDGSILLLDVGVGRESATIRALNGRNGVLFAEPNWLRQPHVVNDPGFAYKWDLDNQGTLADGSDQATADADVDWQEAYDLLGAAFNGTATVAVIDTGIDAAHPDLDGKIAPGYDYLSNDGNPNDTYGHGTHVAGITLAETNNSTGIAGMAYSDLISVMPLRVCDSNGCPTSAIVNAIYYAISHGANVINLSLGGRFGSSSEEQAINAAWSNGLVVVASSGNDGGGKVSYPAAFANAIAVGSTNWHDAIASYSNKGGDLDVVAPGGDMSRYHDPGGIYSTMPTYDVYLTTNYSYSKNYDQLQGTSMAAPQVSGLAALLFAANPALTNVEVRDIIEQTADDLGSNGWDRTFGHGRINAYRAVQQALGVSSGTGDDPPSVALTAPANGATVAGIETITANAGDDNDVASVTFAVDNVTLFVDTDGNDGWTVDWDTTTAGEGSHSLSAKATDSIGQTASDSRSVVVDNVADATVTVLSLNPDSIPAGATTDVAIAGSGFAPEAAVTLENGSGPAPTVDSVAYGDSGSLVATITAKGGGPPRARSWDVRVTNPDGSSGSLAGGLNIQP